MTGPSVQLQQVSLTLGGTDILKQIDWQIEAGKVNALVGPNGCGKSSLLKSILGLMPHQGEISLGWSGTRAGVVGYVPQALECDRTLPMTVMDFLASMRQARPLFWGVRARIASEIEAVLERVQMAAKADRRMGDLSGGERQRVLLAQSLLPPPALVLLDEPMAALDTVGIDIFHSLLQDWKSAGCTVIWVEHDLDAVRRLADRVTGLNGNILFDESPDVLQDAGRLMALFSRSHHAAVQVVDDQSSGGDVPIETRTQDEERRRA